MREDWTPAMARLAPQRRRAMEFLYNHLPESDLDCYPVELFQRFADHALALRETASWCAGLEQEIFDHYVLFPRVNDEDLSFHRALFHDALWPRIQGLSTGAERVLEVNRWCHEAVSYQQQDDRTASPLTVFRSGSGRCGEESAFLVSALRSVGIPARQVYVPRWAHCDDNHAWVEALCDGRWRFLGACEPEPVLDLGWFNSAASQAILVHSRLFGAGDSPLHGELLSREGGVCWYNQTARYAPVRIYTFRALREGMPAPGTVFQIQVLNESGFHTIAALTAGEDGEASAVLGVGTLHVLAALDGLWGEGDCVDGSLTLHLHPPAEENTPWTEFDVCPPKAAMVNAVSLDAGQRADRAAVLRKGSALREARMAAFYRPKHQNPPWDDLLRAARGNCDVISAFLEGDGDPRREILLRTLTDKDLRDITEETLEDHLQNVPVPGEIPPEIYLPYVLCPRVGLEPLTPWRRVLREAVSPAEQAAWRADPRALWAHLKQRMNLQTERTYDNLVWTPAQAWQAGRCDQQSLRVLYVALLRTLGVPARLRALDGAPEFWRDGRFFCVRPEETGRLCLTYTGETPLVYRQNWTLSRWTEKGWTLLTLSDGDWRDNRRTLVLPAGQYRLITSVRLPNGNQFAARREIVIRAGEEQTALLYLRPYALEDMLCRKELPVMPAVGLDGGLIPDLCRMTGKPTLLFWLEEGSEPTEHVLNELAAGYQGLEALPVEVVFLIRGRDCLRQSTLAGLLEKRRGVRVLLDDWAYDLEQAARLLTCDPDTPPLAVVCDGKGWAVYGVSGYHVGAVELLTRIAAHISGARN